MTTALSLAINDSKTGALASPQATTSGTSFDFTGIPSWVAAIDLILNDVSLSGTDNLLIQLGDAGGIETTGYVSTSYTFAPTPAITELTSTSGFVIRAAISGRGTMVLAQLRLVDAAAFKWVFAFNGIVTATNAGTMGGGNKTLSQVLTQVRLTRTGADTFDAGSVNLLYRS